MSNVHIRAWAISRRLLCTSVATGTKNKVSRYAAIFAFMGHGLARELHLSKAQIKSPLGIPKGFSKTACFGASPSLRPWTRTDAARPRCANLTLAKISPL